MNINYIKIAEGIRDEEQKIGTCELCGKENVIVEASGYHVAFVCVECMYK